MLKFDSQGLLTIVAGNSFDGFSGDGGAAGTGAGCPLVGSLDAAATPAPEVRVNAPTLTATAAARNPPRARAGRMSPPSNLQARPITEWVSR